MRKPRKFLGDAVREVTTSTDIPSPAKSKASPMDARSQYLGELASGNVKDVRLKLVDPKVCRMWNKHNRLYHELTRENCDELINSIRSQGRQEIPAVVRRLSNDPDGFEYEVVSGARRHFAVSWLRDHENRDEILFLVEPKDFDDEAAFRFSDLENRGRQDISDYERGKDYLRALESYYEGNLTRMATRLDVSKAKLSAYCSLARLPSEVISAYASPNDIAMRHSQRLAPLINDEAKAARVIAEARALSKIQDDFRERGQGAKIEGVAVLKRLCAAAEKDSIELDTPPKDRAVEGDDGRKMLTFKRRGRRLVVEIELDSQAPRNELLAHIRSELASISGKRSA